MLLAVQLEGHEIYTLLLATMIAGNWAHHKPVHALRYTTTGYHERSW